MTFRTKTQEIQYLKEKLKSYKKLSFHDELTELFNRRKLERDLHRLCYDYKRYNHRFIMIFMDIDGFKKINDTQGHLEGDKVLKTFAITIKNAIRTTDRAYRPSGDEFVILLPHTNIISAKMVLRRIKKNSKVSISYGIGKRKKPKELLKLLDKKMFESKRRK